MLQNDIAFKLISATSGRPYRWLLNPGSYIIGRSLDCDLIIEDVTISRKHAQLEILDGQRIILKDLDSHNGSIVNGVRISRPQELKPDDIISIGCIDLRLTTEEKSNADENSVFISDGQTDMANVTLLQMEQAIKPLSSKILENPEIFRMLSDFGNLPVIPGGEQGMLDRGLNLFKEVIPSERVAVFTVKQENEVISIAALCVAGAGKSVSFSISRTILREIIERKTAILIPDTQIDSKYSDQQSIISSGIKSAMAVPLYDENKVFGILYVDTSNRAHHYNENYLRIAATFGNMLAAKMLNNILLNERRIKDILESELSVAAQIQNRLRPHQLPVVNGYRLGAFQIQCKQVGGDLYDIAGLDDGRLLFLIADVSGKGVGAALLASNILAAFRALYDTHDYNILDATRRVSRQLLKFTRPGDFATLFIGMLDPQVNLVKYVNAGHPPPLVVRNSGAIERLDASGVPIGALDLDIWKEEVIRISPGDFLIIFTDGIPEAMNESGEQFENERLEQFVSIHREQPPEELTESIMAEVNRFIGNNPRSDDITMIIIRREIGGE